MEMTAKIAKIKHSAKINLYSNYIYIPVISFVKLLLQHVGLVTRNTKLARLIFQREMAATRALVSLTEFWTVPQSIAVSVINFNVG